MPPASLTSIAPTAGAPVPLLEPSTMVGTAPDCQACIAGNGVMPHHALLELRGREWWVVPADGSVLINATPVTLPARLRDRDQLTLGGITFDFATGETRTRRMESAAEMMVKPRRRRYGRLPAPPRNISILALASIVLAVVLVAGAAAVAWYGLFHASKSVVVLDDRQAGELDSLLVVAYDHVERGGTLLELGLGEGAAQEFARAVNTLALSDLRNNPQVKPRIEALEASVAGIYRERSLAVPGNYAGATSPLTADQMKTASLTVPQFAAEFALMAAKFAARFGHEVIVSGRDHAEHVALYGKGGAMDLSIKTMNQAEVQFMIDEAHARHIRVKDFSQDSVLRRQVQSAIRAGLLFEAGTGLHIHIDRFANRRDRWTTLRRFLPESGAEVLERRPLPRVVASAVPDAL